MSRRALEYPFLNLGHALDHFFMMIFPVAVLTLGGSFGLTYETLLPLASIAFASFGLATLPAGWLGDRWSGRGMLIVFFIGIGFASILTGFSRSVLELGLGLGAIGLFGGIYHPVGIALVVEGREKVGVALGINGVAGNLGIAFAALITGALIDVAGWRAAFIVPGAFSILAGLAYAMLAWSGPAESRKKADRTRLSSSWDRSTLVAVFTVILVGSILAGLVFNVTTIALPKLFADRLGNGNESVLWIGSRVSAVFAVASVAQIVMGQLLDRYPIKRLLVGVVGFQALLLWLTAWAFGPALLMLAFPLVLLIFAELPIGDCLVARHANPAWRARIYAVTYILSFGASAGAAPFVAWLHGKPNGFATMFVILAACAGLHALVALLLLPDRKRATVPAA